MPSSMIHLLTAYKVNPNAGVRFWIGNIAPDAVSDWHKKDITHFRNLSDRTEAINKLAQSTESTDEFAQGILLHLFVDWKWDTTVRDDFINKIGNDWFVKYREELSLVGSYAFHHTKWSKEVFEQMDVYDMNLYGTVPEATSLELKNFISRNKKWHGENNIGPSLFFTPDLVEEFINKVAKDYVKSYSYPL